jgi:eukaryotic-like serine/threonine-protein kinase
MLLRLNNKMRFKSLASSLPRVIAVVVTAILLFIINQISEQESISLVATTSSSQFTTTTPSNFLIYENATFGLKFQSPSNWNKIEISSPRIIDIKFISPVNSSDKFPSTIDIAIEKNLGNITSLDRYTRAADEMLNTTFSGFNISDSRPTSLAGFPAIGRVFDYKLTIPAVDLKSAQILAINNDKAYVITYTSEAAKYFDYLPILQEIMSSFQITK